AESDEDGEKEEEGSKAEKKAKVKETVKKEKKALYESHLNESEINRRLKKKQVYQGKLRMASDCCWRGVVVIPG
ncbi:rnb family domain-containing protein, partial [Cystoisospora suis]